jgi:hypothetical protein
MIKLDILSDPICPWCYIGWSEPRPRARGAARPPFRHRMAPVPAQSRHAAGRHGPPRLSRGEIRRQGSGGSGLSPRAPACRRRGPDPQPRGHRPHPQHARRPPPDPLGRDRGRQTPVVLALFRAYFTDGRDIGDAATLADIAQDAGHGPRPDRNAALQATPTAMTSAPATPMPARAASPACPHSSSPTACPDRRATDRNLALGHRRDRRTDRQTQEP